MGSILPHTEPTKRVRRLPLPQAIVGESPRWDADRRRLVYVDIFGKKLNSFDPASGGLQSWDIGELIGFWVPTTSRRYLIGGETGLFFFDPDTLERADFLPLEADNTSTRCNDARCDSTGRLWVSTMAIAGEPRPPIGALYSVEPDGSFAKHASDLHIANTINFCADEKYFFFSDTLKGVVWRYSFDVRHGKLADREDCFRLTSPGLPDGSCLDADGALWIASTQAGRIERRSVDGALLASIELPCEHPTMCAFGGENLTQLFVTSFSRHLDDSGRRANPNEGALFEVSTPVRGIPENRFKA